MVGTAHAKDDTRHFEDNQRFAEETEGIIMREDFSKYAAISKCPICGGELEKGYIGASRGITWDPKKSKRIFVYIWSSALILLFGTINIPALKCEKCKLVLFGYEKAIRGEFPSFLKKCVGCGREIPIASEECQHCGTKQPLDLKKED